jgi:nitrite reductase (NADH) small subunit
MTTPTIPLQMTAGSAVPRETALVAEHNLGAADRIPPGEGREFLVDGRRIAVFRMRLGGGVYASQAECPHQGGPLADGLTGGDAVICPYHAWRFDLRTGEPLLGDCRIATYPARISPDGDVLVTL